MVRSHQKLEVWKESIRLVVMIYKVCEKFPSKEQFILVSQMCRAAVSIPSNIAEGAARGSKKEFLHFVIISRGSLSELETQLIIATNLGYLSDDDTIFKQIDLVSRLLSGLKTHLCK